MSATDRPGISTRSLHFLHWEASAHDRTLVLQALSADTIDCQLVYAGTKDEFSSALEQEPFDLILANFTLTDCTGEDALALARGKCPDVPFLFVSDAIGDERVIEAFRSGATDFVLKQKLERLLPAVHRALDEARERLNRRANEDLLRLAEAQFRGIFENAVEGIYQANPQGRLLQLNQAMARLCGYGSPAELCASVKDIGRDLHADPSHRAEFDQLLGSQGHVLTFESRIKHKDGSLLWISENARAVRDAHGRLLYCESFVTDITARKMAENALRQSEERFREMTGHLDDVFYMATLDTGRWSYVSPAYEQIWGRPVAELYTHPDQWTDAIVPEDRANVVAARDQVARGEECRIIYRIRRPDGALRWIEERSYPIRDPGLESRRAVGIAIDVTHRRQLEAQLLQAQKMEAIGQLAGGMAHDFNNVLTVIVGYARLLLDRGSTPPNAIAPLTQIFNAGTRASNLTRQLLVFSRKQSIHLRSIDLNQIANDMSDMLGRLIGEQITLQLKLTHDPCLIEADEAMLEQALMNLAVNARDAMPHGGTLTITTERITITDAAARHQPEARAGEFVVLSTRDTGCGIPPEILPRVFEPFFTTKDVGEGTGLGLAMVFATVQQHRGWIELESAVDVGTCVRIVLPALTDAKLIEEQHGADSAMPCRGSETILLAEDEPAVRELAAAVLSDHGYRVLQAKSGLDALDVWQWHEARIALLLTDLVMPDGLGGIELASRLRKKKPQLRVLLTSGYSDETFGEGGPPSGTHFIHKPYKPQMLLQAVRDALDDSFDR